MFVLGAPINNKGKDTTMKTILRIKENRKAALKYWHNDEQSYIYVYKEYASRMVSEFVYTIIEVTY